MLGIRTPGFCWIRGTGRPERASSKIPLEQSRITAVYVLIQRAVEIALAFTGISAVISLRRIGILLQRVGNDLAVVTYAEHFIPPVAQAGQYFGNFVHNAGLFLAMDAHMDAPKKRLFESFYRSITDGAPVPIPYREILLTSRIMDEIFAQIRSRQQGTQ